MMSSSVVLSNFKLLDSKNEKKLCADIEAINKTLNNLIQSTPSQKSVLEKNSSELLQILINDFLKSEIIEEFEKKWGKTPGIEHIDAATDLSTLPRGIIYIRIKKNNENIPVGFGIAYKHANAKGHSQAFYTTSPASIEDRLKTIRENNLTYLQKDVLEALNLEIDDVFDRLEEGSNKERLEILAQFNAKWQGKLTMQLTLHTDKSKGVLTIKDNFDLFSQEISSKYFIIDTDTPVIQMGRFLQFIYPNPANQKTKPHAAANSNSSSIQNRVENAEKKGFLRNNLFAVAVAGAAVFLGTHLVMNHNKP